MAGTVTLLFTDLVGSTELLGRLGDDAAARLRRRHFAALREAISEAGGHEVKSLGDGLMVVFPSAAAAVGCARAMQRVVAADDDGLGLRVGLHAGEPSHEDDDYFGTPVVIARRLCDRAQGGQILASDVVRGLLGPAGAGTFRSLGPVLLKGLAEPVAAWEVAWSEDAEAPRPSAPTSLLAPLPEAVAAAGTGFVGRQAPLDRLSGVLQGAGHRLAVAAVGGEPGIGKTRLAAEFARRAHAQGAVVLFGRWRRRVSCPTSPSPRRCGPTSPPCRPPRRWRRAWSGSPAARRRPGRRAAIPRSSAWRSSTPSGASWPRWTAPDHSSWSSPRLALEWTLRAAAGHVAALAWEEAAGQLEAALELMDDTGADPAERAQVLERLADLRYMRNAELDSGIECLEDALRCYRAAGLDDRAARIHSRLGRDLATYWGPTMDIGRAAEHIAAAEAVLGRDAPTAPVALLNMAAATVAMVSLDAVAMREAAQRAAATGREIERPLVVLNAEILDAWGAAAQGDPLAEKRIDALWEEADARNHPWLAFVATWLLSPVTFWQHGVIEQARRLDRELARPRAAGAPGQRRLLHNLRAQRESVAGRLEPARAILRDSPLPEYPISELLYAMYAEGPERATVHADAIAHEAERAGNAWSGTMGQVWRARALDGTGDVQTWLAGLRAALARLDAGGFSGFAAYERARLAMRLTATGETAGAREELAAARAVMLDDRWGAGHTRLLAAEAAVAAASGEVAAADSLFAHAVEDLERRDHVYDVASAASAPR